MPSASDTLRISLLQTDIFWNDKKKNLERIGQILSTLKGKSDLAVLPETCTTGFTMQPRHVAEEDDGETVCRLKEYAAENGLAIAGSFAQKDKETARFHNRAFLITPEGSYSYSDKRHLFRIGGEADAYSPGQSRPLFFLLGWRIALFVCYDLRFPVWTRRSPRFDYDLAIYTANWPNSRIQVWDSLLIARAIENQAYVCGVNRVGNDGNRLTYNGHSSLISPRGETLLSLPTPAESMATASISRESLLHFREKFPVWKDADDFSLKPLHL